jgi:hypothetical protein
MSTASTITRYYGPAWEEDPPLLEWDDWPVRDHPATAVLLLLTLTCASAGVFLVTGRLFWTVFADLFLVASFARALLKATYRLGPYGVERIVFGRLQRIPWRAIRAVRIVDQGVFLFDTREPTPVDVLRAVFVPFGPHREGVLARLEFYLASRRAVSEAVSRRQTLA